MQHQVKDLNLKDQGKKKIDWASKRMYVLNELVKQYEKEQPLKGVKVGISLHLEAKTAYLAISLKKLGAEVSITSSNPITAQDDVAAALTDYVDHVYAWRGETPKEYELNHMRILEVKPNIIIDDGADLSIMSIKNEVYHSIYGVSEETTTGVRRLRALERDGILKFPAIAVNDAKGKYLYDNRFGSGQSVVDGLMRSTNSMIGGKEVVVVGYGWVGKGVAERLRGLGARVTVVEVDPFKALEAYFDGYKVTNMDEASRYGDIFITCTGDVKVITGKHMLNMKDGAFLSNAGHFDVEIDMAWLRENAKYVGEARPNVSEYVLPNGKKIYVLAEGRLVNLGAADGHPIEIMDLSFSLQLMSVLYLNENRNNLQKKVYTVPEEIDKKVVETFLNVNGIVLEKLTDEQKSYLESWR
ncbi:MAG: adenosylhomocysteinase [Thaumarchaeota archaeon]|jgi:adenosylhomocysteinase|nr:adenosylhomocysteinase [Nitrososphaerota archaeon]